MNYTIPGNLSLLSSNEPMMYVSECLKLNSDILTQFLYFKITIVIFILCIGFLSYIIIRERKK
jgi:hypothetical protein